MYMLILVDKEDKERGVVSGPHMQWCCACDLEEAAAMARATEEANSNRISVAVIEELHDPYAFWKYYKDRKRLDC